MFICPGCKTRFRVTKVPRSGRIKCPKCGKVSAIKGGAATAAPAVQTPGPPPAPEIAPNTEIAGHTVLEHVGSSEFTAAYKASQTSMGRTVLFKVLRSKYADDESVKAKFFSEARAIARFNHPNLLSVFDMGEEVNTCFFTTEFVDGNTLPQFLNRKEKISSRQRLSIATQIAQGLACAESAGVKMVWLEPKDVLLTDKEDVRIDHIGVEAPLRGGSPEPIINAFARLLYMAATGGDLPPKLREPGTTESIPLPTTRDELGSKLNALVTRLLTEQSNKPRTVSEFAADLEELSASAQRRTTVSATAAPGGVVPIRLEKVRHRELPMKTVLIVTAVVTSLCVLVLLYVLWYRHSETQKDEAAALWEKARLLRQSKGTRMDALRAFEKLANKYPGTRHGQEAKKKAIDDVKKLIVSDIYGEAEAKFEDRPRDTGEAIAAIRAAQEKLESLLPGFPLVKQQSEVRIKNVNTRYERAAISEWKQDVHIKIESYCREDRDQYGKALAAARDFAEKWPEAKKEVDAANSVATQVKQLAEERFSEIMKQVDGLRTTNPARAQYLLGRIIRNFGMPKYVEQAQAALDSL